MSKAARLEAARSEDRIAMKCRHEVEMFKAVIAIVDHSNTEVSKRLLRRENARIDTIASADGYSENEGQRTRRKDGKLVDTERSIAPVAPTRVPMNARTPADDSTARSQRHQNL